VPVADAT